MSSLSKLAVQIALEAAGDSRPDFLVFCSQHGELTRLREMLRSIVAVGADTYTSGTRTTGSLLVERMKVAGS